MSIRFFIFIIVAMSSKIALCRLLETPPDDDRVLSDEEQLETTASNETTTVATLAASDQTLAADNETIDQKQEPSEGGIIHRYNDNRTLKEIDLVFVLDRSGSVPKKGWIAVIEFVKKILEHFTVDKDNTRVAVVTYSTGVTVDLDDLEPRTEADGETKCTVLNRLDTVVARRIPHGYTATYAALMAVYQSLLNSRPNAKKAVIVVTDGKSNIGPPPLKAALDILALRWHEEWDVQERGPQVEIYGFGVEETNMPELRSISSSLQNHVFLMSTFNHFKEFARTFHGNKQEVEWASSHISNCGGMCRGSRMYCVCGTKIGLYSCVCEEGHEMSGTYCRPCKMGYFKDTQSPEECKPCPENMTTNNVGSNKISDCKLLPGYVRCPNLPEVEHASKFLVYGVATDEIANTGVPCDGVTDGNSCHYACDVGYRLTGSPVMTCNYSGVWEGEVPSCKIINCHPIEQFYEEWVGVTVNYLNNTTTFKSLIEVTCRSGTVANSWETVWSCDEQGQWTLPWNFQCTEIFCGPLVLSSHAIVEPEECRRDRVTLDTQCEMRCAFGFQQDGPTEFFCNYENGLAEWNPSSDSLICDDVLPPSIVCPGDIDVMVSDWGQNNTVIYYDKHEPIVSDNSGHVSFTIRGAPEDKRFLIGFTELIYEATDEAGLKASCKRYVHVKGRTVVARSCPSNITSTATSLQRTSRVSWPDPIFLGPENRQLPFVCSMDSGREFIFGLHNVVCYPETHPGIKCQFQINVTDPPCPIPYEDRAPLNGALICGSSSHHYPRVCRIHCRDGYEIRNSVYDSKHLFVCRWDGTWNLEEERWPECVRSRKPMKVLMENQLYVRFSGLCHDVQSKITEGFLHTIEKVLESEHGPCPDVHLCKVEDVKVHCGSIVKRETTDDEVDYFNVPSSMFHRSRRTAAGGGSRKQGGGGVRRRKNSSNANVEFRVSAEIVRSDSLTTVNEKDRRRLLTTLDDIFYDMKDVFDEGTIRSTTDDDVFYDVTSVREISRRFSSIRCSETEVETKDDLSNVCYTCAAGSYQINGVCRPCPIGTYQPNEASTHCQPCPVGTNTSAIGGRLLQDCTEPCPPGHFSRNGFGKCESCAEGTFQDSYGSTLCIQCPNGRQTLRSSGSSSINDCVDFVDCQSCGKLCNGGRCFLVNGEIEPQSQCRCFCPHGHCEEEEEKKMKKTHPIFCYNDGLVVNRGNNEFRCQCSPEFTGVSCEILIESCESSPCQNGGSCVDYSTYFLCRCVDGFIGQMCELNDVSVCSNENIPFACRRNRRTDLSRDFDVVFKTLSIPLPSNDDDRIHWILPFPTRSLTVAMWLRGDASVSSSSTILSFVSKNRHKTDVNLRFQTTAGSKLHLSEDLTSTTLSISLQAGVWNFLTVDWTSLTGFWRIYINSSFVDEVYLSSSNAFVNHETTLTLGESFDGEMSQFVMYDRLLNRKELSETGKDSKEEEEEEEEEETVYVSRRSCRSLRGSLLQWTDVLSQLPADSNSVTLRNTSWCSDINECLYRSLHSCLSTETCVDSKGSWECRPCEDGNCHSDLQTSSDIRCDDMCQNNSTCSRSGSCFCRPEFTGTFCESFITVFVESCLPNPCLNGGSCARQEGKIVCQCREYWIGKYCQVSYSLSCELNPCVNNGTCVAVVQPTAADESTHYRCICPELHGRPLGANCEELAICETLPCLNGGTCVNLCEGNLYRCMCDGNHTGQNCENHLVFPSPLLQLPWSLSSAASTVVNFCQTVECQNGGSCINTAKGFQCKCQKDNQGQYCDEWRSTETSKFHVIVNLLLQYDSRFHFDTTFKEIFRLQIHHLFSNFTADSKMYVVINDIRKGNSDKGRVEMDFTIIFTFHLDSVVLRTEAIRAVFVEHLLKGKLGTIPASFDDFRLTAISNEKTSGYKISLTITILLVTITLVAFFFLLWCRRIFIFHSCQWRSDNRTITTFDNILNNIRHNISNVRIDESQSGIKVTNSITAENKSSEASTNSSNLLDFVDHDKNVLRQSVC